MTKTTRRWLLVIALLSAFTVGIACSNGDGQSSAAVQTAPAGTAEAPSTSATQASPLPAGGAAATAQPAPATLSQPAEPDGNRAFAHIHKLADEIGIRPSGTPQEHAAAEYIAATLRDYGYDVQLQRFPVNSFISRSVSLEQVTPARRTIEAQPLTNSRAGSASGEIVYAGIGRRQDFTDAVRGKIALVERGELTHQEKAAAAAAAGASALVIFNNADEIFLGQLNQNAPAIPVLSVSGVEGRALRDRLQASAVRASLTFDGGRVESDSFNVIARSPGTRCEAVLGGHYDSVPGAPGASDNASGTAAVIEMARVQAQRGNPEHACFAAFGSEETGLDGSRYYVESLGAEDKRALRFMLNFDMVAFGTEWLLIGSPTLQEQGRSILRGMGLDGRFIVPLGFSSDHASFINGGIPALFLHRSNDPLLHTPEDVSNRLSVDQLTESMRIGLAFLQGMSPA